MTGAQRGVVARGAQVFGRSRRLAGSLSRRFQFFYLGCGKGLEAVQLLSELTLAILVHIAELIEKCGYFAFLAEQTHPGVLYFLRRAELEILNLSQQGFYPFFHI